MYANIRMNFIRTRAPTTFKLEGEATSLSESSHTASQGEVGRLLGEVNCD